MFKIELVTQEKLSLQVDKDLRCERDPLWYLFQNRFRDLILANESKLLGYSHLKKKRLPEGHTFSINL